MVVCNRLTSGILESLQLSDLPMNVVPPEVPDVTVRHSVRMVHMHLERLHQSSLSLIVMGDFGRVVVLELFGEEL